MTSKEKLQVLKYPIDEVVRKLEEATQSLEQAQDDWCIKNSCDGDRSSIKKAPILSVCDGTISVKLALKILKKVQEDLLPD